MSPLAVCDCHVPTLSIPTSASGIAAWFLTTSRRTPPAHQYSTPVHLYFGIMSVFSFWAALYAALTVLPAYRCPAAPSAPVYAPVLRRPSRCRRGPSSLRWGFLSVSAISIYPAAMLATYHRRPCPRHFLLPSAPPRLSSTPCVLHALPAPSPTFADSPSPPLLQPSLPLVCPSRWETTTSWMGTIHNSDHGRRIPAGKR